MIKGIGIDIVDMKRIDRILERKVKFADRILTEKEFEIFCHLSNNRKIEFLAGRFAAKEAYAKARGTGLGESVSFQDIEVLPDERGKPVIHSNQKELLHLSISHSKEFAIAQVIIEQI